MLSSTTAALIMAGGRSQRMRAGGAAQHKGLRTVRGAPLIEHNLLALLFFGFKRIQVAVNQEEQELAAWVASRGSALAQAQSATLELLLEREPLGTIGAAARVPPEITELVIVNVDNLTSLDLRRFIGHHRAENAAVTIAKHDQPFQLPFGMLELSGQRVLGYREKPKLPVPISSGAYVLSRRAIEQIPAGRRFDVPALIERLLLAGEPVLAFAHEEPWIDVNDEAALAGAELLLSANEGRWPGAARQETRGEP